METTHALRHEFNRGQVLLFATFTNAGRQRVTQAILVSQSSKKQDLTPSLCVFPRQSVLEELTHEGELP
jgi:hypothetical protein